MAPAPTSPPAIWGYPPSIVFAVGAHSPVGETQKSKDILELHPAQTHCQEAWVALEPCYWARLLLWPVQALEVFLGWVFAAGPQPLPWLVACRAHLLTPGSFMGNRTSVASCWPSHRPCQSETRMWFASLPCLVLRKLPLPKGLGFLLLLVLLVPPSSASFLTF